RADLHFLLLGQLRQRERGRPHRAVVELRRLVEAKCRVPRLELLRALEEADDLAVEGVRGHAVPRSRRQRWRGGLDDRMDSLGHGPVGLRQLGDLLEDVLLAVRLAAFELSGALLHRGPFLGRESLLLGHRASAQAVFSSTAARMRSLNACASTLSPSWTSSARLTLPSRLELNRPAGSSSEAPLKNVSLTLSLYASPVQMPPSCDQTGVPPLDGFTHFHSSTTSGSACRIRVRSRESVSPRQPPSSSILASISSEGDSPSTAPILRARLRDRGAEPGGAVRVNQLAVRDDQPLDGQVRERVESRQQSLRVGVVQEDVQPAARPADDVTGDEGPVLPDEEHDLLRLAVELERLDTRRQLVGRRRVGDLRPPGARRRPDRGAVALHEVLGAAVVRALCQ